MPQIAPEKLNRVKQVESSISRNLFFVSGFISVIAMIMALVEFFSRGAFPPSGINVFYIGVLLIYSLHKEFLRWLDEKEVERQGEWFLYSWIGLTVVLYIINFWAKGYFSYSQEGMASDSLRGITFLTLEVSGVFILARFSKIIKIILEKK